MKYRKALFVVTYAKTGKNKIEYLILKRKLHWRGWEFPKGAIKSSEAKIHAVKRELFEETGSAPLKIKKFNYSGKYNYDKIYPDRPGIKGQTFTLYAAEIKKPANGKIRLDRFEHSDYKWVGYEKALKMLRWPNQKKSLRMVNKWLRK